MNLAFRLAAKESESLTQVERAQLCCRLAKQLEKAGEYEAACEELHDFWPQRDGQPLVEGLDQATAAHVLLRVGALAGWLGSAHQADGSQEAAKNLITQSIEIFEELGQSKQVAEAQADLALCYWREGAFDEARINLAGALDRLKNEDSDLKAVVLIRAGLVEVTAGRWNEALRFYEGSAPLVEKSTDHALKGTFHNSFGAVLSSLAAAEKREDCLDQALIEYAAASFHFEQAGNTRYCALVENNLGFLFSTIGRFTEAHEHVDRARGLFASLGDRGHVAQVDDTRARTLLAEGHPEQAELIARRAVKALRRGDECSLLVEALTTHGTALARTGKHGRSRSSLDHAIEVAERCGDLEGAGRARLSIVEELGGQTSANELALIYESAAHLLQNSQDPSGSRRLISCALTVIDALVASEQHQDSETPRHSWEGFSLKEQITKSERALIERALKDAGGSVTKAARLLGMSHQSLIYLIKTRHKSLLETRSVVRKRRRRIVADARSAKRKSSDVPERDASQISILHVEDNEMVAKLLQETLGTEGMHVDSCASGTTAMKKLKSDARYDLIIVDNDLPGIGGLELIRRARGMGTRRRTPIIMLSGDDCETEAWRAGVGEFLRKPEDIEKVSLTVARLLEEVNSLKTRNRTDIR
jgi:CheY-like chemotaxis protein/tetratricopeptide (TPR) repeat protein